MHMILIPGLYFIGNHIKTCAIALFLFLLTEVGINLNISNAFQRILLIKLGASCLHLSLVIFGPKISISSIHILNTTNSD